MELPEKRKPCPTLRRSFLRSGSPVEPLDEAFFAGEALSSVSDIIHMNKSK